EVDRGGNADGRLSGAEVAMALAYMGAVDTIFRIYDADGDSRISKAEAVALMDDMNIGDERAIDAYFANVGLRAGNAKFWEGFTLFLVNTSGVEYLRPNEFLRRMEGVLGNYY